jgi:3-oxoacyl-[acyl-carrier protein] reductase
LKMKQIRGRKSLVTGAASPAGRSIALALAREGADLFLLDSNAEELVETAQAARVSRVQVLTAICELTNPGELRRAAISVLEGWGPLQILVNNTDEMHCGATHAVTEEQWERVLSANLVAPIELVRVLLPTLALQDEAHIVNLCSIFGLVPARRVAAYQTAQFGMVGFTAALRAEYIRRGFGMTALCPTPNASSDEIGAAAIRAIRKNKAVQLVPASARLDWMVTRLFPGFADRLLRHSLRA